MTAAQALEHKWLFEELEEPSPMDIIENSQPNNNEMEKNMFRECMGFVIDTVRESAEEMDRMKEN